MVARARRQLLALNDVSRQRTIPSAAQGISKPWADIANPSKMTPNDLAHVWLLRCSTPFSDEATATATLCVKRL